MREIGRRYLALENLYGYLNLSPPMQINAFNETQKTVLEAYNAVALQSMTDAVDELQKNKDEQGISDVTVSCDGSWQKRGQSSLNGVVTVISSGSGKCLDYRVMIKTCKACEPWESRKGTEEYELFLSHHECDINHEGSSGSMEAAGIVECFISSEDDRKLRYVNYIGDGDSKFYSDVVAHDPYHGKEVKKLECVEHIQKRLGARLRKLKTTNKSALSNGKPIGGKGRLTDKIINKLQNYFGIAIRQSKGETVHELKKAIGAVLFHCSEASNLDARYQMCPRSRESWCKFQANKINNTS